MPSQASQVVECVRWGRVGESPEKCEAAVSCMDVSCVVVPSQVEVYTLQCARRDLHCTLRSCHVRCAGPPPRVRKLFLIETYRFFIAKTGRSRSRTTIRSRTTKTPKAGIMEKRHPRPNLCLPYLTLESAVGGRGSRPDLTSFHRFMTGTPPFMTGGPLFMTGTPELAPLPPLAATEGSAAGASSMALRVGYRRGDGSGRRGEASGSGIPRVRISLSSRATDPEEPPLVLVPCALACALGPAGGAGARA